ncbi:hypothetical protein HRbin24_00106 [bacterium HR24]|nr:hypothetical protein HRbin24_00106 [bacterium HR24]
MRIYRLRTRTLSVPHPLQVWLARVSSDGAKHEIRGPFPVLAIRTIEIEVEASLESSMLRDRPATTDYAVESWLEQRLDERTQADYRVYFLLQHDGTRESPWVPLAAGGVPAGAERAFFTHEAAERAVREALEKIARRSGRQG